jgi:hypothetical protein
MESDFVKFRVVLEVGFQVSKEGRVVHADGLIGSVWEKVGASPENGHIICGRRSAHDDHAIADSGLEDGRRGSVKRVGGGHCKFGSGQDIA